MEKKNDEATLEKLIMAEDELRKCKRELDLLKEQLAREETNRRVWMKRTEEDEKLRTARFREEQRESEERERKWKERYEKLWEDFEKVDKEKAKLECRVSALEFEKAKAERGAEEYNRRFEDLNRRISQLEEDAALLMSAGLEERRGEEMGPVAETTDEIFNELVTDGNEGVSNGEGSGNENVNELLVKGELNCCENAESLSRGGGSAPGTGEVGSSHRENGPMVIIEIDDSDDEMPTRKRSLFTDDNDDAKPNKKCHTKPIQQLDLPDDSDSSDSEDSASSDSFIDSKSEIARLNRKLAGDKTWAFKADMMAALNREPELCMNAVCALYRKELGKVESFSGSSFNINRGFNHFDALRGTNLGKYLTGGDPQGKLKRSVSELQEFDSNGLKDCKNFSLHYSDQLYEIYQKKQDAFFLPP